MARGQENQAVGGLVKRRIALGRNAWLLWVERRHCREIGAGITRSFRMIIREDNLNATGQRIDDSLLLQAKNMEFTGMELHGSTERNLIAAVRSASRLRGHPVHADTIKHWANLLHHARRELSTSAALSSEPLKRLVVELEVEMSKRPI